MCKLTNQSFSHLLVWFRELCETNPGDNLMDSWIERTWIIQTWISNTILSVLQKRENRNTFLGTFELYLIGMHQPVLPLKRVLREVESSFLGLVLQMGEKRILGHWAAWLDFKVCRICLKTFYFHHCIKIFFVKNQNFWQNSISCDLNKEMMWLVWVFCKNLLEFRFPKRKLYNLHVNPRINRSGLCPAWFLGDDHGLLIKVFWSPFLDHESWFMMFNNLSL